eukprot:IDg2728t1
MFVTHPTGECARSLYDMARGRNRTDTVLAARTGFILEGTLVFLRINTLVCDQKEERAMLSLKSKGSYMYCSHCLLPSLSYNSRSATKEYLKRTSASQLSPALSAVYGLGSKPFHIYQCVGLDKLHAVDLGILRMLPAFAFTLFSSLEYNCADEKHANMTGKLRRSIAPFLWVALMGLHPEAIPDEDLLLQSALAMDRFQTLIRSINMSEDAGDRSENEIGRIQSIAFGSCLWLSKALRLPISTKLHRVMRHVKII